MRYMIAFRRVKLAFLNRLQVSQEEVPVEALHILTDILRHCKYGIVLSELFPAIYLLLKKLFPFIKPVHS